MVADIINYILVAVEVLSSILLIGAILLQKTKGQGIGLAFGSGMGEAMFGARAGNVLTRATVVLAIIFLVNTTLLALLGTRRRETSVADSISGAPVGAPARPGTGPGPGPAGGMPADAPMGGPGPGVPGDTVQVPVEIPAVPVEAVPPVDAMPAPVAPVEGAGPVTETPPSE
jgi:preprotein translocase subunit SecG